MLRILLIRHGATDLMGRVLYGRLPGIHLSDAGRLQVQALGADLASRFAVQRIVTSSLDRALETTSALQKSFGCQTSIDDGWLELDYGEWVGLSLVEIRELESWQRYNRTRSTGVPPGGESMMQVQARAWQSLDRILRSSADGETTAVVSHGDVIRALLVLLLGIPLDHIHRFEIAPASWSEVQFDGHHPRVICVNSTLPPA